MSEPITEERRIVILEQCIRKFEAELGRLRAVLTCAADDLAAQSILEHGSTARALVAIAKELRAALEEKP